MEQGSLVKMMKAKIHRAVVTQSDLHYEGSIGIDEALMDQAGLLPNEAVHVWNVNTGGRWETYVIPMPRGSGEIQVNGAAARLAQVGDLLIIAAFSWMPEIAARVHTPRVVLMDDANRPVHMEAPLVHA